MLNYNYVARNAVTGQQIKASVEAESEAAAAKVVLAQGLTPTSIKLASSGFGGLGNRLSRVSSKDRVLFSRQLSTLINAGLPLLQALRSVNGQTTNKTLKVILTQIITDIEGGATLSSSMAKHPKVFNQIYISLIAAGETSGTLDTTLDRLALQQEKDADMISKIRGAMTYPAIVMLVMLGVVGFMVVKVIPQVKILYAGIPGASLPLITRIMLDISGAATKYWWVVIIVLIALVIATTRYARTGPGKIVVDKFKMKAWPVGPLFMKMYMARFARTASTLISSGVPLLQVLEITGTAINNVHVQASLKRASELVKGGKSLALSLEKDPNFLPLVPSMLQIGEQSGSVEQMLAKTADYFEKEVDNQIAAVSSIIEPVMMVILGVVAFIIVAAVLLPIYGLAGNSSFTGS